MDRLQSDIAKLMRDDWGRLLAVLIGNLRDFQFAEDCLSDAFSSALEHWPRGYPRNPQGWLLQVARRKAISRLRRAATRTKARPDLAYLMALDAEEIESEHDIPDERLRLIFTACHPALDPKTRIALTLRTLCGLATPEIARAFLDKEATMAQRLARAKTKIAKAGIPYDVPGPQAWEPRLTSVLTVIYLIFNEGYSASTGEASIRGTLCDEAIRLARAVHSLCPTDPEVAGLLALLLLNHARSPARLDASGTTIPLELHDRTRWNHGHIREGLAILKTALRRGRPGPFQLQAAISAVHAEAADFEATRWDELALIYDRLVELVPTPVVALNRAVALSFAHGPALGLANLPEGLEHYQSFHAARADMLRRQGRTSDARDAYDQALALTRNEADRLFLEKRRDALI